MQLQGIHPPTATLHRPRSGGGVGWGMGFVFSPTVDQWAIILSR